METVCHCTRDSAPLAPDPVRRCLWTDAELAEVSPSMRDAMRAHSDKFLDNSALHEAGHVTAAAGFGRPAEYATIGGGAPHVIYASDVRSDPSLFAAIISFIAGDVAKAVAMNSLWRPEFDDLLTRIGNARSGHVGTCDRCAESILLNSNYGELDDRGLVELWRGFFEVAFSLFYHDEWRGATLTLGRALQSRTLLLRDDIDQIVGRYDLVGARREVIEGLPLDLLLPGWRPQ